MTLTFIAEIILEVLLAATLGYCIVLERRLAAVRKGQEGLKTHIGELNMAIAGAGASLRALKTAAAEAAVTLDERLKRARLHIDELSVLTASGERIADRIERASVMSSGALSSSAMRMSAAPTHNASPLADIALPSNSIMDRLGVSRTAQ
jgi:ABC-type transporter Mla subunit MlaD